MSSWKTVGEAAAPQVNTEYENIGKLKKIVDVGFFLENYVVEGGVVTKDIYRNDTINVTNIVVALDNDVTQREGTSFKTKIANAKYFLDYQKGDFVFGTSHPAGSFLPVAEVTTDGNKNVLSITDKRGATGGFRLLPGYMYPEITELQQELIDGLATKADLNYTNEQLSLKRNKADSIKGSEIDTSSDSTKIGLNQLKEEVKQAMAGTTPIFAQVEDNSVSYSKYAPESMTVGKLAKDVYEDFHGELVTAKKNAPNNDNYLMVEYVFDTFGFTFTNSDPINVLYDLWTDSTNLTLMGSKVYLNNSITDPFNGVQYDALNATTIFRSDVMKYDVSRDHYVIGYQYVHVFVAVRYTDWSQVSEFAVRDVTCRIAGNTLPFITRKIYEDTGTIRYITSISNQLATLERTKEEIESYIKERTSPFNGFYVNARPTSGQLIQMGMVFDTQSILGLVPDSAEYSFSYVIETDKSNIIYLNSQFFINNVPTFPDFSGTAINPGDPMSAVPFIPVEYYRQLITVDKTKRYVQAYINVTVADPSVFSDFEVKRITLKIGDKEATPITDLIPYVNQDPASTITKVANEEQLVTVDMLEGIINSRWYNKKMNVLGDSITEGYMTSKPYHQVIKERKRMSVVNNYGIGGSTIAKVDASDSRNSMALRYTNMTDDADLILVLAGTNDQGMGVPIGTMNDRTVDTFYGACHVLFKGLLEKYQTKTVALITALQKESGRSLLNYVNAYIEVAQYYSIPVIDLFRSGGLCPDIPIIKTTYVPDGLHPNTAGHVIMADKIGAFMETL